MIYVLLFLEAGTFICRRSCLSILKEKGERKGAFYPPSLDAESQSGDRPHDSPRRDFWHRASPDCDITWKKTCCRTNTLPLYPPQGRGGRTESRVPSNSYLAPIFTSFDLDIPTYRHFPTSKRFTMQTYLQRIRRFKGNVAKGEHDRQVL